jgi:hypothetical protein
MHRRYCISFPGTNFCHRSSAKDSRDQIIEEIGLYLQYVYIRTADECKVAKKTFGKIACSIELNWLREGTSSRLL